MTSLADLLLPDDRNANAGTERGTAMLAHSLSRYGLGRSVLADRDGRLIAGNKTVEQAVAEGLVASPDDVIIVPTDGRKLVVVQRTDLSLDDERGRGLAIADNRVAELNLAWDGAVLAELADEVDLAGLFTDDELGKLTREAYDVLDHVEDDAGDAPQARPLMRVPLAIVLAPTDWRAWDTWKASQGLRDDTVAFLKLFRLATGGGIAGPATE